MFVCFLSCWFLPEVGTLEILDLNHVPFRIDSLLTLDILGALEVRQVLENRLLPAIKTQNKMKLNTK